MKNNARGYDLIMFYVIKTATFFLIFFCNTILVSMDRYKVIGKFPQSINIGEEIQKHPLLKRIQMTYSVHIAIEKEIESLILKPFIHESSLEYYINKRKQLFQGTTLKISPLVDEYNRVLPENFELFSIKKECLERALIYIKNPLTQQNLLIECWDDYMEFFKGLENNGRYHEALEQCCEFNQWYRNIWQNYHLGSSFSHAQTCQYELKINRILNVMRKDFLKVVTQKGG